MLFLKEFVWQKLPLSKCRGKKKKEVIDLETIEMKTIEMVHWNGGIIF